MKPTTALALAALAGPAAAQSLSILDSFMRDLHISFRALTSSHPRRAFHRRVPGQLAKRCIPRPNEGSVGNTTSTLSLSSTAASATATLSTGTRTSTNTRTSAGSSTSTSAPTTTRASTSTSTSTSTSSAATPSSTWKLQTTISGSNFFDQWAFWSTTDPTHGAVDYQTQANSVSNGLIEINSAGNAIMRVENTTQVSGNRKSVRIQSNYIMNGGLVVLDAVHMPYGCGTWPAFWTTDEPNWPTNGEIDILEGVNGYTKNQASLHTASGCTIPAEYGSTGTLAATTNCAALETTNQGCGQLSSQSNSYGKPFNDNGGGVYAMLWQSSGISIYFFPRGSIPSDITSGAPQPSTWGTPAGNWPSTNCDPATFMKNHQIIFDTTLCGEWGGSAGAWTTAGLGGQGDSCATSTGSSTCLDYIRNNGAAFTDAYWEVKSVKVYTT